MRPHLTSIMKLHKRNDTAPSNARVMAATINNLFAGPKITLNKFFAINVLEIKSNATKVDINCSNVKDAVMINNLQGLQIKHNLIYATNALVLKEVGEFKM